MPVAGLDGLDAVFVDRDGTLNHKAPEGGYIASPHRLRLLNGVAEAVRLLNRAGVPVLVVTNQRGVALGSMTMAEVEQVNMALQDRLRKNGAHVDGFYVCPHGLSGCACRKPMPGLLYQARRDRPGLEFSRCVTIGDAETDVAAGRAAGTATIRLASPGTPSDAGALAPDLLSAVRLLSGILHDREPRAPYIPETRA